MKSTEKSNALLMRIIDREAESSYFPYMYLNRVESQYRIDNRLSLSVPFIKISDKDKKAFRGDRKVLEIFNGHFPIHPANLKLINNKSDIVFKNCYFSGSHRTFTFENFPYYFKLDLPYQVSSSKRFLTRSDDRILASKISFSNLHKTKSSLVILDDIFYGTYLDFNVVIRNKIDNITIVPLYALICNTPFDKKKTILDWLIENSNEKSLEYCATHIIKPIIDAFFYFVDISKNKYIHPSNFHRQNINLAIINKKITGIVVQDIDMNEDYNVDNVLLEYDTFLSRFFWEPLTQYLHDKYSIPHAKLIDLISSYANMKFLEYSIYSIESNRVKNSHNYCLLLKHLGIIDEKNKFFLGDYNPYR